MSIKRKPNHFLIYDFDYEESWLNDLSAEGLLLTGEVIRGYEFEKSGNRLRRYRVSPKGRRAAETNSQYLYLRKGRVIVYVSYCGKRDLIEGIDLFTGQLCAI